MPRKTQFRSRPDRPATSASGDTETPLDDDRVRSRAARIADGHDPIPDDLSPRDRARLEAAVRRRLRDRMVRLIARAIAAAVHRGHVTDP